MPRRIPEHASGSWSFVDKRGLPRDSIHGAPLSTAELGSVLRPDHGKSAAERLAGRATSGSVIVDDEVPFSRNVAQASGVLSVQDALLKIDGVGVIDPVTCIRKFHRCSAIEQ